MSRSMTSNPSRATRALAAACALLFGSALLGATDADAQTCPAGHVRSTPDSRFTTSTPGPAGESVVIDSQTGLMWKACSQGLSGADCATGTASTSNWSDALTGAAADMHAGFIDWRLPNANELSSIHEFGCHSPAINGSFFPATQSVEYWTATTRAQSSHVAETVSFGTGHADSAVKDSDLLPVRLVRSGSGFASYRPGGDETPDAFTIAAQAGVARNALISSAVVVAGGIDVATAVSVSGATDAAYSVNGSAFSSLPGAVSVGDQVVARHTSSADPGGVATSTLTIGGVTADFTTTSTSIAPPGAPTIGTASAGNGTASVAFTAPAETGGAAIVSYTASSAPGVLTGTCAESPCTVTGLSNGAAYTFTVTASNGSDGPASTASNSVVPQGPQAIVFGSAPTVYADGSGSVSATGGGSGNPVVFNSLTSATCSVSGSVVTGIVPGDCTIAANQAGSAAFSAAPQVTQTFAIVAKTTQAIVFAAAPSVLVGGSGEIAATGGDSGNPVLFSSLTAATCSISGSTVTGIAGGDCTIAANQAGSETFSAAPQATQTFTITKAAQAIVFGSAPTVYADGSGSVSATGGGSGNPVVFNSLTSATCSVSGSVVTGIVPGDCTIAANQAGSAAFSAAPQVTQTFAIVAKTTQAIVFAAAPSVLVGGSGEVAATGGDSGNPVLFSSLTAATCSISGSTVTGIAGGDCTIAANQAGSETFSAAPQATQTFTITKVAQAIVFGSAPSVVVGGAGAVSATAGGSASPVVFSSLTAATCGVSGSTVTGVTVGDCTIAANQAGDAAFTDAPQVTQTFAIDKGAQTITFAFAPRVVVGGAGLVSATGGASGNAVTFSSTTATTCSIGGGRVIGQAAGTCTITANQPGDANYDAAEEATLSFAIGKGAQAITFAALPAYRNRANSPFTVSAGGGASGNPVTFASTTTTVCSTSGTNGSSVTLVAAGTCTLRASQAGNADYAAAADVERSFTVGLGDPPTIAFSSGPSTTFPEDHNNQYVTFSFFGDHGLVVNDPDGSGADLTVTGNSNNAALFGAGGVKVSRNLLDFSFGSTRRFNGNLAPLKDANGQATITYTVTDPQGHSASVTTLVTVEPRNDPPTASYVRRIPLANGLAAGDYTFPNFVLSDPAPSPGPDDEAFQTISHIADQQYYLLSLNRNVIRNVSIDSLGSLNFTVDYTRLSALDTATNLTVAYLVYPLDDGPSEFCDSYLNNLYYADRAPDQACGKGATISFVFGNAAEIGLVARREPAAAGAAAALAKGDAATTVSYRITVQNRGNIALQGVRVTAAAPNALDSPTWTCTSPAGPCSPASGSGAIDTRVDLGIDQDAEILLTGTLQDSASFVTFSAKAVLPEGVAGEVNEDDAITVIDAVSNAAIHYGGFE